MDSCAELESAMKSEEKKIPDNILPMIWMGIKSIYKNTTSMKGDIDQFHIRTKAPEETNTTNDSIIGELQCSQVQVKRGENLRGRSMRDNLIIHFNPAVNDLNEAKSENCVGLVKAFRKNTLGITSGIYTHSAYRLGKPAAGSQL